MYSIDNRTDKEVGGVFPQVSFNQVKEAFKFKHNEFPDNPPVLSTTLEKRAKLTDMLSQASISGHGLLVNSKVKDLLSQFSIMEHKFFDCPVADQNGDTHQYYWMALVQPDLFELIDFEQTSFFLKKGLKNLGEVPLRNMGDYVTLKKDLDSSTIVKASNLALKSCNLDLFKLPLFDNNLYVSESLKTALTENAITGIEIKKAPMS
jgi:hypothetical protein